MMIDEDLRKTLKKNWDIMVACSGVSRGRAKNALLSSHYFNCCHCYHGNLWRPGLCRDFLKFWTLKIVCVCVYFHQVYLPCVLQTKKRYVGYMYESLDQKDPVFDAKGIETVRRDSCPAVSKVQTIPSVTSWLALHQTQRQNTIHTNNKSCTASELIEHKTNPTRRVQWLHRWVKLEKLEKYIRLSHCILS